jgi:hypothetical protein
MKFLTFFNAIRGIIYSKKESQKCQEAAGIITKETASFESSETSHRD